MLPSNLLRLLLILMPSDLEMGRRGTRGVPAAGELRRRR
jgi:hypothetical protein